MKRCRPGVPQSGPNLWKDAWGSAALPLLPEPRCPRGMRPGLGLESPELASGPPKRESAASRCPGRFKKPYCFCIFTVTSSFNH